MDPVGAQKRAWPFSDDDYNRPFDENFSSDFENYYQDTETGSTWHSAGNGNEFGSHGYLGPGDHQILSQAFDEYIFSGSLNNYIDSGTEDSRNICFGCIVNVHVQLQKMGNYYRVFNMGNTTGCLDFEVTKEGEYLSLMSEGTRIALLNKSVCEKLGALSRDTNVRLHAYVGTKEWKEATGLWQRSGNDPVVAVELNLYGLQEQADQVGTLLCGSDIYLQQPRYGLSGFTYYNPHYLQPLGSTETYTPMFTETSFLPSSQPNRQENRMNPSAEVESILDSLSHNGSLHERTVDARIRQPLLPHQKEAIDFIFKRETGQLPDNLSLWQYNDTDSDEPFYQHLISGAKREQQAEAKGGIIADDMGLGKTLVILASVAGSLDRAARFVSLNQEARSVPSRGTLVIAPSSLLLDSWIDEIRNHTFPGDLTFHKYHGQGRVTEKDQLFNCDIVLTTYATVSADFCNGKNILGNVRWFRVVLDEAIVKYNNRLIAHDIRNRSTKQFQAIMSLSTQHSWCLTGTPIQNALEDLSSLVSFLKVPILESAATFRKFVTSPSKTTSKDRFLNLQRLLQTICLRRTREILRLPEPVTRLKKLCLSQSEQIEYNDTLLECRKLIDMTVSSNRKARLNSTMLESLLKLRLFCNNGSRHKEAQKNSTELSLDTDETLTYLQQDNKATCAYCQRLIYSIDDNDDADGGKFITQCRHLICRGCIPQHYADNNRCPACSVLNQQDSLGSLPILLDQDEGQTKHRLENYSGIHARGDWRTQYPSKLVAFVTDIQDQMGEKSIAFSAWKKTLFLIGEIFVSLGISYYCIDGSLSLSERRKVLAEFRSSTGANVLLMTLGTGAVGLNLAVASRIYILEPQWNPSIELQAIGRALRLGQTDQVTIIRYVMQNTVEDSRVLSRQHAKLQLAGGGDKDTERFQNLLGIFGLST